MSIRIASKKPHVHLAECDAKFIESKSKLVIIDFHAAWCDPCHRMAPIYEDLAVQHPDVVFLRVDVDECEALALHYNVQCMPTYVFVRNKKQIEIFSGANENRLKEMVLKLKRKK